MSARDEYWVECIAQSAENCGAILTKEQIEAIAADVQASHENYGLAFYQPSIDEHPVFSENKQLKKQLQEEREKILCRECNGHGRIIIQGPYHSSDSQCWKCSGYGRHKR